MKIIINDKEDFLKDRLHFFQLVFSKIDFSKKALYRMGNYHFLAEFEIFEDIRFFVRVKKDIRNGNLFIEIL